MSGQCLWLDRALRCDRLHLPHCGFFGPSNRHKQQSHPNARPTALCEVFDRTHFYNLTCVHLLTLPKNGQSVKVPIEKTT